MQRNGLNANCLALVQAAILLMLAPDFDTARAAQPGKPDSPKLLSDKIIAAWKDAGAEFFWIRGERFYVKVAENEVKSSDLPVFRFANWQAGRLAKLPDPAAPFGLFLYNTPFDDVGLKELSGLKSLRSLNLSRTQITDAGLKELAGLKNLRSLYLGRTAVTDAGIAELRKALPKCRISVQRDK